MFDQLRASNQARQDAWPGGEKIDLAFRGLELGGEAGELLNKLKKLVRMQNGIQGNKAEESDDQHALLMREITDELADVVICADLISMHLGIDLASAIPRKFNKTSNKNGIPVFFQTQPMAFDDIARERCRQIETEGWTTEHDDTHGDGSLARVASCYALFASHSVRNREYFVRQNMQPDKWPNSWLKDWWKPTTPRRDLVKAAALLIAEIERIDRAEEQKLKSN